MPLSPEDLQREEIIQLATAGASIALIGHDFSDAMKDIYRSCNAIAKLNSNSEVSKEIKQIKAAAERIDSFAGLFTIQDRRIYRRPQTNTGDDLARIFRSYFSGRMSLNNISFVVSNKFSNKKITGKPAEYVPAFLNVIGNAIYWLGTIDIKEKEISLDADDEGFIISNNGPSITVENSEKIFEFGFSSRGSTGFGLALSKEMLQKFSGFDLILTSLDPVSFKILTDNTK